MEDIEWAREYLERHQIHELWEECVQELVLQQHKGKEEITACINACVIGAERRKLQPAKHVTFAIGVAKTNYHEVVQAAAEKHGACTVIAATASMDAEEVGRQVSTAIEDTVIVTDFPRTISDAIAFEANTFIAKATVAFVFADSAENPASQEDRDDFIENVNPVASYYKAVGRHGEIVVDDPKANGLDLLVRVMWSSTKE
jgi:hypothetical protein